MKYLHTMVRVNDLDQSLNFYCGKLGLREVRRWSSDKGRFTIVHLAAPEDPDTLTVELTHNWEPEKLEGGRNFGHLAFQVEDIYGYCGKLVQAGITINRPPRDGKMAFIRSPDGVSIELLQRGDARPPMEPWASMPNTGTW